MSVSRPERSQYRTEASAQRRGPVAHCNPMATQRFVPVHVGCPRPVRHSALGMDAGCRAVSSPGPLLGRPVSLSQLEGLRGPWLRLSGCVTRGLGAGPLGARVSEPGGGRGGHVVPAEGV